MTRPRTRASARFAATSPPPRTPPGATPARPPPPPGDPVSFRRSRPPPPPTTPASRGPDSARRGTTTTTSLATARTSPATATTSLATKGENDPTTPRRRHRRRRRRRARNGGAAAASAASRLYPALVAARAGFRREPPRVPTTRHGGSRGGRRPPRAPEPRTLAAVPSSVPHLPPSALEGATRRARCVASALDDAAAVADVVLHPARSAVANGFETTGPTTRACATAVLGMTRECRDAWAPAAARRGRGVARARRRCWKYARASRRWRSARGRWRLSRAPRFPRLRTVRRRPRRRRGVSPRWLARRGVADVSRSRRGVVVATPALCASAQPYLAATHAGIEEGALDDVVGEFFVREGEARGAKIGTEAHWERGFELRRGRLGEPECPEFFAACAEELLAAGKAARLMRAEDRPGWIAREDSETGSREEGDAGRFRPRETCASNLRRRERRPRRAPRSRRGRRRGRDEDEEEDRTRDGRRGQDDDSVEMLRGTSLEAFPCDGPGVARSARIRRLRRRRKRRRSSRAASRDRPRVVAFVGERVEWGGHRFDARRLLRRRRVSTWCRRPRRRWRRRRVRRDDVGGGGGGAGEGARRRRGRGAHGTSARSVAASSLPRVASRGIPRRRGRGDGTRSRRCLGGRRLRRRPARPRRALVALAEAIAADESDTPDARDVSVEVASGPRSGSFTVAGEGAARLAGLARIRVRVQVRAAHARHPRAASSVARTPARFSCSFARRGRLEETATSGWTAAARRAGRRAAASVGCGRCRLRRRAARTRRRACCASGRISSRRWTRGDAEGGEGAPRLLDGACRRAGPDRAWTLLAGRRRAALAAACDLAAARRRTAKEAAAARTGSDGGTVRGGDVGCGGRRRRRGRRSRGADPCRRGEGGSLVQARQVVRAAGGGGKLRWVVPGARGVAPAAGFQRVLRHQGPRWGRGVNRPAGGVAVVKMDATHRSSRHACPTVDHTHPASVPRRQPS